MGSGYIQNNKETNGTPEETKEQQKRKQTTMSGLGLFITTSATIQLSSDTPMQKVQNSQNQAS